MLTILFVIQASLFVRCHQDSYTEAEVEQYGWDMSGETELDLLNYARLRHAFLQNNPIEVPAPVVAPARDEGGEGDEEETETPSGNVCPRRIEGSGLTTEQVHSHSCYGHQICK